MVLSAQSFIAGTQHTLFLLFHRTCQLLKLVTRAFKMGDKRSASGIHIHTPAVSDGRRFETQ